MNNTEPVNTFYLLDLDRTLFDTMSFTQQLFAIVSQYDAGIAQKLTQKAEQDYVNGVPFAAREEIEARFGPEKTDEIEHRLLQIEQPTQLLLPGALDLISFTAGSAGILTYGEQRGQTLKLKVVQLDHLPHLITSHRVKGELMEMWQQDGAGYQLPVEYGSVKAKQLVLVDDRIISFQGIPSQARGYWVAQAPPTTADVSVLPANVMIVRSLGEVIDAENQIDKA